MLKIAVCDDEKIIRRYLKSVIERELHVQAELYASGEELLEAEADFDILFLDICLDSSKKSDRIDGMETARRFRRRSDAILIFVTAMPEYVYDAYDVEAFHYLLKPICEEKLIEVMQKAAAKAGEKKAMPPLPIKINGKYLQIVVSDILYAENDGRKVVLHTKNGEFSYYEKMEALERKLGNHFFRSHRGYLVHLQEVAGYDRTSITLKNGDTVFLAKQKYNDFVEAYMNYLTK